MKQIIITFMTILFFLSCKTNVYANTSDNIIIDTTKINQGTVSVKYNGKMTKQLKVQISNGDTKYVYTLLSNMNENIFPLQMKDGEYKVAVLENITGNKYTIIKTKTFSIKGLSDSNVFVNSIQLVYFKSDMKCIKDLKKLTEKAKNDKEKITIIYNYIINNFNYDYDKAKGVQNDYIPNIEIIYKNKKGICYDYASLFAAILRELKIPTKLQMGYYTEIESYHAWNKVLLDGNWQIIDTTYDAQAQKTKLKFFMLKDSKNFKMIREY